MSKLNWIVWIPLSSVLVSARPWSGPRETFVATATANWSPRPTRTPEIDLRELSMRGLSAYPVDFCGVQGPDYVGAYCSTDSSCAWFTDITVVGCCATAGSCDAVYTSCLDGDHAQQTISDPAVFTCTSTSVCYANTYDGGYIQYGCGTTSVGQSVRTSWPGINTQFSIVVVKTTYGAMKAVSTIQGSATAAAAITSTSTTASSQTSGNLSLASSIQFSDSTSSSITPTTSSAASTTNPSADSQITTSDPSTSNKSTLSTGAIIAISVLAGVVALISLAFFIFFFCIRRRRNSKSKDTMSAQSTPSMPNGHLSYAASQLIPEMEQPPDKDVKDGPVELYDGVVEKKMKSEEGRQLLDGHRHAAMHDRGEVYEVAGDASWPVGVQELHGSETGVKHDVTR